MSRSRRRTPVCPNASKHTSEKQCKRRGNRACRRINKVRLQKYTDDTIFATMDEMCNEWSMMKDGRHWYDAKPIFMNPEYEQLYLDLYGMTVEEKYRQDFEKFMRK